jgi:hypothetical protein
MYRPQTDQAPRTRRGMILLVVLAMLTLFAVVGLSFVFYANSEATSSRVFREAGVIRLPEVDPELAFAMFLSQLIYDVNDDQVGVDSALRGHSLVRLMYGHNQNTASNNNVPFNGVGRLHEPISFKGFPQPVDGYDLVNYQCFSDANGNPVDGFLRDPERLGTRIKLSANRGPFTGGFNVPYTYPDLNNLFLAAVKADGTVLVPSFHRPWLRDPADPKTGFGTLDPQNPNWYDTTKPWLKYLVLRPRPADNPGFPPPEDAGGDVKNLVGAPGGNDSIWLDIGAPVMTLPDGRKFKALFAPLIIDLDGKVNVNVHGNIGPNTNAPSHGSNQGWGPWEVNLGKVLNLDPKQSEWAQLLVGSTSPTAQGKYGTDNKPVKGGSAGWSRWAHYYGQVDYDGRDTTGKPNQQIRLPGRGPLPAPAGSPFPIFPSAQISYDRYGNGSAAERLNHPLRYNVFRGATYSSTNDDRVFAASNMAALLRFGDTGAEFLTSELLLLCPQNFITGGAGGPAAAARVRRMVTTHSFDVHAAGVVPYVYNLLPLASNPNKYTAVPNSTQAPAGTLLPFPSLAWRKAPPPIPLGFPGSTNALPSEFTAGDWRALKTVLGKINLNRTLRPYPLYNGADLTSGVQTLTTYNRRFDSNNTLLTKLIEAQQDRQNLARDIYRRLVGRWGDGGPGDRSPGIVGVPPVKDPTNPTDEELAPRRWLAQLAVNIVDFIDEDDISTPFNFYTHEDDGLDGNPNKIGELINPGETDPDRQMPRYWVFGTEMPHVVLNEVLAETPNVALNEGVVKVWLELHNPFTVPPAANVTQLQQQDGFPVQLRSAAASNGSRYAPYKVILAAGFPDRPLNDNSLGGPIKSPVLYSKTPDNPLPTTFTALTIAGQPAAMAIPAGGFFLMGPSKVTNDPDFRDPFVGANVPPTTPVWNNALANGIFKVQVTNPNLPTLKAKGITVLLRRLANPHMPPNSNPLDVKYNPYVTVDYMDKVPLRDTKNPQLVGKYASRGKRQPYGGLTLVSNNDPTKPDNSSPVTDQAVQTNQVFNSFGQPNQPMPLSNYYEWLVHLDRQLVSPMELLHVSGHHPYQLTQQFILGDDTVAANKFGHYAPWFDAGPRPWGDPLLVGQPKSNRFYRALDFLYTPYRVAGVSTSPSSTTRIPGKVNINTIWDPEIFLAVCDAAANSTTSPNYYTPDDVAQVYQRMLQLRTAWLANNNPPDGTDRPFWGLGLGSYPASDAQFPGFGIENTLLRSFDPTGRRLFQAKPDKPNDVTDPKNHPYIQAELLTKIFNNLTTRSNVFAVWVTVGFFEVKDTTVQPVKLGAEIGRAQGRHVRHRMFAIIDRTRLTSYAGPPTTPFNPHNSPNTVPYFAIID